RSACERAWFGAVAEKLAESHGERDRGRAQRAGAASNRCHRFFDGVARGRTVPWDGNYYRGFVGPIWSHQVSTRSTEACSGVGRSRTRSIGAACGRRKRVNPARQPWRILAVTTSHRNYTAPMKAAYSIGLDYGTNSVRALLV